MIDLISIKLMWIYNLWEEVMRIRESISAEGLADEFITNVAKKYTLDEIKIVEEEEIANMFTADFDYKLEEMREKNGQYVLLYSI